MKILQGILVALVAMGLISCSGTKQAYEAANGLEETAYVMSEHYNALVQEAARLNSVGVLVGEDLVRAQDLVRRAEPLRIELSSVAQVYADFQSAETEAELTAAIASMAVVLSDLVTLIDSFRSESSRSSGSGTLEKEQFNEPVPAI